MNRILLSVLNKTNKLGDIPEIVNNNFNIILNYIDKLYDEDTETLTCMNLQNDSIVKSKVVQAVNVIINLGNGQSISLTDFIEKVNVLYKRFCKEDAV